MYLGLGLRRTWFEGGYVAGYLDGRQPVPLKIFRVDQSSLGKEWPFKKISYLWDFQKSEVLLHFFGAILYDFHLVSVYMIKNLFFYSSNFYVKR
jgi:hypothetical protein